MRDNELDFNVGKTVHQMSLSPKEDIQGGSEVINILNTLKHQLQGSKEDTYTTTRGVGMNGVQRGAVQEESSLTYDKVFNSDTEVESLVINTLLYDFILKNPNYERKIQQLDFDNDIITDAKQIFFQEISQHISDKLKIKYDFTNKFSSDLADYLGAVAQGFLNTHTSSQPFNINLPVLFKLIGRGLITFKSLDHAHSNYSKLFYQPFVGGQDSPDNICKKAQDDTSKAFCIVEYSKALTTQPTNNPTILKSLTSNSLSKVPQDFSTKQGYRDIWDLIKNKLTPKTMYN